MDTFITEVSSVIRNWPAARVSSARPVARAGALLAAPVRRPWLGAVASPMVRGLGCSRPRGAEGSRDLVDGRLLGRADLRAVLAVGVGHPLGQRENEPPVSLHL